MRCEKDKDKERAINDKTFSCSVFDLQKVLVTPDCVNASQMYYSRKLSSFNLSVYNIATKQTGNFIWNETEGKRGSCEIGSILYKYINSLPTHVTHICFFSDKCSGQNHNQFISCMFYHALQTTTHIKIIDHKFYESGHSQNEGDSVHAAIESNKRNLPVYAPSEWHNVIRTARRKLPYVVIPMEHDMFWDLKKLLKDYKFNLKLDSTGSKIAWRKVMWFRYEANCISFKYDFSDPFKYIQLRPSATRRKAEPAPSPLLKPRYSGPLPISKQKKNDLIKLCRNRVIPNAYHAFYQNLLCAEVEDRCPEPDLEEIENDSDME